MDRYDYKLNFTTDRGEVMTVNIPHADATATAAEVGKAMDDIITSGILLSVRGTPAAKHSAELIKTTSKDFNVA